MTPARNRYEILPCGRAVIYIMEGGAEHATLIDAEDLPRVLSVSGKWYAQRRRWTLYAACTIREAGARMTIRLHRFLTDCPADMEVDHIDHDGLNNTRANLRIVTPDDNKQNVREAGYGRDVAERWYEAGCAGSLAAVEEFPF